MSKMRAGLFPRGGPKASIKAIRPNCFIQEVLTQTLVCKRNHSRFNSCGIQEKPAEAALTDGQPPPGIRPHSAPRSRPGEAVLAAPLIAVSHSPSCHPL